MVVDGLLLDLGTRRVQLRRGFGWSAIEEGMDHVWTKAVDSSSSSLLPRQVKMSCTGFEAAAGRLMS